MVIYFIYGSVYMLIPNSSFIPPLPSPLVTISLFSMSVGPFFLFDLKIAFIGIFLTTNAVPVHYQKKFSRYKGAKRDFPGGPVIKTLHFQCRGHGFDPWSGKFCMLPGTAKKIFKNK